MPLKYFWEIAIPELAGHAIILDVDGTLCPDGAQELLPEALTALNQLKAGNEVYLCSNKKLPDRIRKMAENLGVKFLEGPYRKPSKKILQLLPNQSRRSLVVIGDKVLTDGLLARNIGARFIHVASLRSKPETLSLKISYLLDKIAQRFF